jgi:flagellar hook protein FlgE
MAAIGTVGLVNFASPEGLSRVGQNLLAQSTTSGEPIVGRPTSGTFGSVKSGSIELSTVDIASEFVKIITLQRGFQASSRIITTINSLLNEIIQLA